MNTRLLSLLLPPALALGFSGSAMGATTNLGALIVGTPTTFSGSSAPGSFTDTFTFTLPANGGSGYSVANFALPFFGFNTTLSSLTLFSNPDGILSNGDDLQVANNPTGGNSIALTYGAFVAGPYYLKVVGIATGTSGGLYNGAISVAAVPPAPVPEPESYALMLAGIGIIGFVSARRRHQA